MNLLWRYIGTGLESGGHVVRNSQFFDTLKIQPSLPVKDIKARAEAQEINLRYFPDGDVLIIELFISVDSINF